MQKKNTMGKIKFVLEHVLWAVIAMIWYKNIFFRCLGNMTLTQSRLVLWGLIVAGVTAGILLNWKRRRCGISVVADLLVPYGAYTVFTYLPIRAIFIETIIAVGLIASVIFTIMIMGRKILNTANHTRIIGRRVQHSMRCTQTCMALSMAVIMLTLGIGGVFGSAIMWATPEKTSGNSSTPYATNISNNMETVLKLQEDVWNDLTVQERLNVLQTIADIERNYLGISNELNVGTANLSEELLGYYDDRTHEVIISMDSLLYDDVYEVLDTLCHEVYHSYQHRLVDAYVAADTQTQNLRVFKNASYYLEEFSDYKSGTEDFCSYYAQECESDAREYAESSVLDYYYRIYEYLGDEVEDDET